MQFKVLYVHSQKREIRDVLFLLCQIPGFIENNKSSIKIEDLEDQKLF